MIIKDIIMAWLRERRSRRWSTATAGTFVADITDARKAGMVATAAAEGLVRV